MNPSQSVEGWRARGQLVPGPRGPVFVVDEGSGTPILILHGFPSATYEWRGVVDRLVEADRRVVALDLYGYGFSTKDLDGPRVTLGGQADLVEAVIAHVGLAGEIIEIVAHDMGDTIAAELGMRLQEATLSFGIGRITLTNGSIFIDLAELSAGQRALLSLPDAVLLDRLPLDGLIPSMRETFAIQPPDEELAAMLSLVALNEGDRLLPRLIRYIEERREHQARYTQGLVGFDGPLRAAWGMLDPIAVTAMVDRLERLRPTTEVLRWFDIGHWPAIECPERLVALLLD